MRPPPARRGAEPMSPGRRVALATALAAAALAGWLAFTALLVGSTMEPAQRAAFAGLLSGRTPLLVLSAGVALALLATALRAAVRRWVVAPARLLEQAHTLLAAQEPRQIAVQGPAEMQPLARAFNQLAGQREALRADMDARVAQAARGVEQERNRLAALMSELAQSVIVCNLDGRIILYNARARLFLRDLSDAPSMADGGELAGIGRSIYTVFDRERIAHAVQVLERQLARGEAAPVAQFVAVTAEGRLLRAQVAPVRGEAGEIEGFVLVLEDVTRAFEEESLRDQLLHGLVSRQRASLGQLQAVLETLSRAEADPALRARQLQALAQELDSMRRRLIESAGHIAEVLRPRWPLQDMLGSDLLAAARSRIEQLCGRPVAVQGSDAGLWLLVESFSLVQALGQLALRAVEALGLRSLQLRLRREGGRAQLELGWAGPAVSRETLADWEAEPMRSGGEAQTIPVREVLQRHGGELGLRREPQHQQLWLQLMLPLAGTGPEPAGGAAERPASAYDFDLFAAPAEGEAGDDALLAALCFTVFDTETTGLEPDRGDEIIEIGAVRIVNGRLLAGESFEQLVDPGRPIPAASIPIHGITPERLRGMPRIEAVLPTFHAFAQGTVLVAHNAAFDMKFLRLLQPRTGLAFRQPVLDTLLLSAAVHPLQDSHRLEAIAARFNIPVQGRHTALGDALLAAQVLLRLIPLLEAMGIRTLGQARRAAQRTQFARLKY